MNLFNPYLVFLFCILLVLLVIIAQVLFLNYHRAMLHFNIPLFKSLIQENPNAILSLDENGRITKVNAATEKLFGYSFLEVAGKFFTELVDSSHMLTVLTQLHAALKGTASECKVQYTCQNGRVLVLRLKFIPMVNGGLFGVYVVVEDYSERELVSASLQETNERLESFFNSTVDAINITTLDSKVTYVNPAFEKMYGWTKEELIGARLPIIPARLREEEDRMRVALLHGKVIRNWETQFVRKDGSFIDVNVSVSPLRDADGQVTGFAAITRDETERKSMENRFKIIAEHSSDMIRLVTADGLVQYASPAHHSLLGYKPEVLIGKPFYINIHPEDVAAVRASFEEMVAEPRTYVLEYRKLQKDGGAPVYIEAHCDPYFDEDGRLLQYVVVSRDVSERKRYEQKLEELAFVDPLTGVANRRSFYKLLGAAFDVARAEFSKQRFALLFLDLDRFKWVNDTMGHHVGDELLKKFIGRVQAVLPEEASLCRLGGDEFAIIYSWADSKEMASAWNVARLDSKGPARKLAQKNKLDDLASGIIRSLQEQWSIDGHSFTTTCSIGISLFPEDGEDQKTLMTHADYALYQAKANGRNLFRYYHDVRGLCKGKSAF
ncbi:diguanylate cyclase (GGDEF)-like protein/PAS domain S-box-containing protein [Bacillus sp. SLBN-46]|uniref:PAS domain S-box protein n=1 Tax=Bacillus sp. SLBN-46 TaxID=3042283 RepID=UPI00285FBB44|nr:PAS domain S-box protein [Bacillus sp. SLBN-46]MDR6121191.1 diguanylate cyclase (GGDEF)-like protein/PAS domain S-box-containing protein [Bacillus sp. SLBN-46]